jgi:glycine betaine/proline transport system permease protein
MAMALDRITEAVADRTDPTHRHLTPDLRRRLRRASIATGAVAVAVVAAARLFGATADYSRWTARDWILARIQSVLDYIANPNTVLFHVTSWIGDHIIQYGLEPLRNFLALTPWVILLVGFAAIALVVSGRRAAVTTFLMLGLIGVIGQWEPAMDTASQVLVATVLAVALGLGLGILAAESRAFSHALRPVNDVLQTLPQLVYLIPLIYLMPVSTVPGVIAGVLYAFPIVVRLVENGLRNVEKNAVEAATSFGATRRQVLLKVRIPLAQDAIMLGVNQGIIMVLAVVVIGGLVGSPGLGYEVAQGLGRSDFGLGVIASVAILALGISLDRVTRSVRSTQPERSP